jgi:hypothetical protein
MSFLTSREREGGGGQKKKEAVAENIDGQEGVAVPTPHTPQSTPIRSVEGVDKTGRRREGGRATRPVFQMARLAKAPITTVRPVPGRGGRSPTPQPNKEKQSQTREREREDQ